MSCSELGETAPKMGGSISGSTKDNDRRGNLDPKVKGNTNENNDVTGGSHHTFAYNQPTNLTPTYENDSDSSKPSEDQYDLSNSIDYIGLSCDDCTADPLSEPGPSKPSKRRKVTKSGNESLHTELRELPGGSNENDKQYRFKATVFEKKFKNQKSFERCGNIMVSGGSVENVLEKIWQYCSKFIHRGVVFPGVSDETGDLKWEDPPTYEARDKFMMFHDKISKRSIAPSKIDGYTLQNWLAKDVTIMLYKYSDAVSTLHKWNLVESQLLRSQATDRAGAESIASLNQVKEELKKRHGRYLSADDVNWGCWANWICSKPLNMRVELTQQTPPQHIIGLFSTVTVHSDVLLEKARLDLQVAATVNMAYVKVIQDLKDDHRQLLNIVSVMGQRISMLQDKQTEYENMLTALNNSVSTRENRFSVELAQCVTDCIDVDHQ